MLDPLTALSLAGNVVQLVDFSAKVVSESRQIYQVGSVIQNDELEIISNDLLVLLKTVQSRNNSGPGHTRLSGTENDNARPQIDHQVPKFFWLRSLCHC